MAGVLVHDLAVVLTLAALIAVVFRFMGQPAVIGYLLAGLVVGPHVPVGLTADPARTQALAELGLILVMFSVGLELNVRRLIRILPVAGFAAILQTSALAWLGFAAGGLMGMPLLDRVFLGCACAISSTMIATRVMESNSATRDSRPFVLGVLVVQDVVAVAAITVLSAISGGGGLSLGTIADAAIDLSLAIVLGGGAGILVVPRLVRALWRVATPELVVVTMVGLAFLLAMGADLAGFSPALGAFFAGVLVGESGRSHDVERVIAPVRHLFAAVFFVSIGMQVDPLAALDSWAAILLVVCLVIAGQLISVSMAGLLTGIGLRRAMISAFALGQIGEFSFVIVGLGSAAAVVSPNLLPIVVTAGVITAMTTPFFVRRAPSIAAWVDHRLPARAAEILSLYEGWIERMRRHPFQIRGKLVRPFLIAGIDGLVILALVMAVSLRRDRLIALLEELSVPQAHVVVDALLFAAVLPFMFGIVRAAGAAGRSLGSALLPKRDHGPDLADAPRRLIIATIQLVGVLAIGAPIVAVTQPFLPSGSGLAALAVVVALIVWHMWRVGQNLGGHVRAATEVLVEWLQADRSHAAPPLIEVLPGFDNVASVEIQPGSAACGTSLTLLDIHARTGASVLVVRRTNGSMMPANSVDLLEPGDLVAIAGTRAAIDRARHLFELSHPPASE